MYDDGLHSPNVACTKAHRRACWGHRDNILGTFDSTRICGSGRPELFCGYPGQVTAKGDSGNPLAAYVDDELI